MGCGNFTTLKLVVKVHFNHVSDCGYLVYSRGDQFLVLISRHLEQDKLSKDDFLGGFMIDLHEVPPRKPPEMPLAPQWYKLEAKTGKGSIRGTWML